MVKVVNNSFKYKKPVFGYVVEMPRCGYYFLENGKKEGYGTVDEALFFKTRFGAWLSFRKEIKNGRAKIVRAISME